MAEGGPFPTRETAILEYKKLMDYGLGPGWVLWYLDHEGNPEPYPVGGDIGTVDSAVAGARAHLVEWVRRSEDHAID